MTFMTDSLNPEKAQCRAMISRQVDEFLARGGKIRVIPTLVRDADHGKHVNLRVFETRNHHERAQKAKQKAKAKTARPGPGSLLESIEAHYKRPAREVVGELLEEHGSIAAVARVIGCNKGTLSRYFPQPEHRAQIDIDGCVMTLTEHCRRLGVPHGTVRNRLAVGDTLRQALGLEPRKDKRRSKAS